MHSLSNPVLPGAPARATWIPTCIVLIAAVLAWVTIEPWRPHLSGDDWAYHESVIFSLLQGRPIVSDWLSPATVGLSIPAALATLALGDLWLGTLLVVGLFGMLGLLGLRRVLDALNVPERAAGLAVLAFALFPAFLNRWTHFEPNVPSLAWMLVGLACYLQAWSGNMRPKTMPWLLASSLCLTWAIVIRQNHLLAVALGGLGILWLSPARARLPRLGLWLLVPALALVALRLGVAPTRAQQVVTTYRLGVYLDVAVYPATLMRSLGLSVGMATLMTLLVMPAETIRRLRTQSPRRWLAGILTLLVLVAYMLLQQQGPVWLAPDTEILMFAPFLGLSPLAVLLGCLVWPSYWPERGAGLVPVSLTVLAAAYVVIASAWGFSVYCTFEATALLFIAGLASLATPQLASGGARHSRLRLAMFGLLIAVCVTSWYTQRVFIDLQVAQLDVVERAMRAGQAEPAEISRSAIPFGLAAWNMYPVQAVRWQAEPRGNPDGFWELFSPRPAVSLQWQCSAPTPGSTLAHGVAQVGIQQACWTLVRDMTGQPPPIHIPHRYLPLTPPEWQSFLAHSGQP